MDRFPPRDTAKLDQALTRVDKQIDRLGAGMRKSRDEGANEFLVIREAAAILEEDATLSRSELAFYFARAADRLNRALDELEARR